MSHEEDNTAAGGDDFARQARALFDHSVDGLDGRTRSRLNQGRQRALAVGERSRLIWSRWLPAAGISTAAVLAIVMWGGHGGVTEPRAGALAATDLEMLMQDDSLEMLQDLDFYLWVDLDADDPDDHAG